MTEMFPPPPGGAAGGWPDLPKNPKGPEGGLKDIEVPDPGDPDIPGDGDGPGAEKDPPINLTFDDDQEYLWTDEYGPMYRYYDDKGNCHDVHYVNRGDGTWRAYDYQYTVGGGPDRLVFIDPPYDLNSFTEGDPDLYKLQPPYSHLDPNDPNPPAFLTKIPPDYLPPGVTFHDIGWYPERDHSVTHTALDPQGREWFWRLEDDGDYNVSYFDAGGVKHDVIKEGGGWYDTWTDENGDLRRTIVAEDAYETPPGLPPGLELRDFEQVPQRNGPMMHTATDQYGNEWTWRQLDDGKYDISYYDKDGLDHEVYERDGTWYDKWTDQVGGLHDMPMKDALGKAPSPDLPPYLQLQDPGDPTNPQGPWTYDNPLKHWGDYGPTVTTLGGEGDLGWKTGLMKGELPSEAHYTATDQFGRKWDWYQADDGTSRIGYTDEAGQWHETRWIQFGEVPGTGRWEESFTDSEGNKHWGRLDPTTGTADRSYTDSSGTNHDEVYAPPGWGNDDNRLVDIDIGSVDWAALVKGPPPEGGNVPDPEEGSVPPGTQTPDAEPPVQPTPAGDGDGGYMGMGTPYVDFIPTVPMVKDPATGQWRNAEPGEIPGPGEGGEEGTPAPGEPGEEGEMRTQPEPGGDQQEGGPPLLDPDAQPMPMPSPEQPTGSDPDEAPSGSAPEAGGGFIDRLLQTLADDPEVLEAVAQQWGMEPEELKASVEEVAPRAATPWWTPPGHDEPEEGDDPDSSTPAIWELEMGEYLDPASPALAGLSPQEIREVQEALSDPDNFGNVAESDPSVKYVIAPYELGFTGGEGLSPQQIRAAQQAFDGYADKYPDGRFLREPDEADFSHLIWEPDEPTTEQPEDQPAGEPGEEAAPPPTDQFLPDERDEVPPGTVEGEEHSHVWDEVPRGTVEGEEVEIVEIPPGQALTDDQVQAFRDALLNPEPFDPVAREPLPWSGTRQPSEPRAPTDPAAPTGRPEDQPAEEPGEGGPTEEAYRRTVDEPDEEGGVAEEDASAPGSTLNPELFDPLAPGPTLDLGLAGRIEQNPQLVREVNQNEAVAEALEQDPGSLEQIEQELGFVEPSGATQPAGMTDWGLTDPSLGEPPPLEPSTTPDQDLEDHQPGM